MLSSSETTGKANKEMIPAQEQDWTLRPSLTERYLSVSSNVDITADHGGGGARAHKANQMLPSALACSTFLRSRPSCACATGSSGES